MWPSSSSSRAFALALLLAAVTTTTTTTTTVGAVYVTHEDCPKPRTFDMACYKCGGELDCIIDDMNVVTDGHPIDEQWEKEEIVRVLRLDGTFCKSNGRTDANQQNCIATDDDVTTLEFAFTSDMLAGMAAPAPVIGDSNKCPITGKYGLSNFGLYTIEMFTFEGKQCCHGMAGEHEQYMLLASAKCDSASSCSSALGCSFCTGQTNPDGGQFQAISTSPLAEPAECSNTLTLETVDAHQCDEAEYVKRTPATVCPAAPNGGSSIVTVEHAKDGGLGFSPSDFMYDIYFDTNHNTVTVKFENPFNVESDFYVSYLKPSSDLTGDLDCESYLDKPACDHTEQEITAHCDHGEAYMNIYLASTDPFLQSKGKLADVRSCCAPREYDSSYGVIEYSITIKCDCPSVSRKLLRG